MTPTVGGVGIFGGTFNPIHTAHLRAALEVREALALDEVRFVPAAVPPHKTPVGIAPAAHRLRMVELAIAGVPGFRVWPIELQRDGPSYTIETLRTLRAEVGTDARIVLILGRDAFAEFGTWREPEVIVSLCDIVVMTRPPWPERLDPSELPVACREAFCYDEGSEALRHASGHSVTLTRITGLDISATQIRALLAARRSVRFLVPPAVDEYLHAHGLYGQEGAAR